MLIHGGAVAQLNVSNTMTPQQLVQNVLVGGGATVSNITFSGSALSIGDFSNGVSTNLGMNSGILLCSGNITNAIGPNNATGKGTNVGVGGDVQLAGLIPGFSIYDAAILEFDFVPLSDTIEFRYIFASEEYPEYVNSNFNDVFGFFISGVNPAGGNYVNQNIAIIPGTSLPVSIDNVNNGTSGTGPCTNCAYYVNNNNGTTIQYDGFTTVLTSWAVVTPCLTYHIKIAIGDAGDHIYDSGVFLEANSFRSGEDVVQTSALIGASAPNAVEGCNDAIVNFTLPNPTGVPRTVHYIVGGSATNGVDYPMIADSVVFPAGSDSVSIVISPMNDNIVEGSEIVQLLVQTSICTYDTVEITIFDYDTVQVNIPSVSSACPLAASNLQAVASLGFPPYQYQWNTTDTLANIQVNPSTTTTYSVVVNDGCGYSDSALVNVNVFTSPTVVINPDSQWVCPNGSANLTASGAVSYTWSPAATLSSTTGATVVASPLANTDYTVIGTDANSCTDTATANISIYPNPVINPINAAVCPGDSILLTANTSVAGSTFLWSNGATTQTIYVQPLVTTTYSVVVTYPNACTQTIQTSVQVYNQSNISITLSNPSVCPNDSVFVQASSANSYSWMVDGTAMSNTSNNFWLQVNTASQIVVIGTDANSCTMSDSTTVAVFTPPTVQISSSSTSVCSGSIAQLTASGASTYSWSPSSSLSSNTGAIVFATPISTTTYNVVGTDANQCKDTAQIQITLNSLPMVIASADAGICPNDTVTLQVGGAQFYSWTPSTSLSSNTGSTVNAFPTNTTNYVVTGTDGNGCQNKDTVNVEVYPQLNVLVNTSSDSICYGNNVNLQASGANTYSWTPASTLSNNTGNLVIASPIADINYQVVGFDTHGCSDTADLDITVVPLPNVNISSNPVICAGQTATLIASGATTYNWTPNGGTPLTTSSISVSPSITQTYMVVGANGFGCLDSASSTVTVNQLPVLSINAPAAICNGDSAQLIASGASTYQWLPSGFGNAITVFPNTNINYTVIGTDANGCTDSISQNLVVNPLPILNITPSSYNSCSGSTVSLSASANMPITSYLWNTGATANVISVNPTTTTNYNVSGTNTYGCSDTANVAINVFALPQVQIAATNNTICFGDTTSLTASGAVNYTWSPSVSLTATSGSSVGAFPTTTTTVTVIGTDANNCMDTASTVVNVNALPVLSINAPAAICNGDSAQLIASGASTYQWLPSGFGNAITVFPNTNTSYTVIGTDANGCTDSISQNLVVNPLPILNITPSSTTTCAGGSVNLTATANMPLSGFYWSTGANGNSIWVNPQTTTTYSVSGINTFGCTDTANVSITAFALPQVQITPANSPICIGDTVLLTASGASTYSWTPANVLSATTGSAVNAFPTNSTMITIIGTDMNMCVDTAQTYITVNTLPVLSINAPTAICNGDSATFVASGALTYQWMPAGFGNAITVSPNSNTSYTVIGTDANGCVDSISQNLVVNPLPILNITPSSNSSCAGSNVNLMASTNMPINAFTWSTGANGNSIWVNPTTTTSYSVSGTNSFGCTDSSSVSINVFALPQVNIISTSAAICVGDTATLIANGAVNYAWSPAINLTSATGSSVGAFPTNSMSISVIGTDANNCVDTASTYITVNNLPILTIVAPNAICDGSTATLTASGANTYQWFPSGNGSSIIVNPFTNTNYTVIGTDTNGCQDSISHSITVNPLPQLNIIPSATISCAGDSVQLTATTNMSLASFNWSNGATGNIQWVSPTNTSSYSVSGFNSFGCSDSAAITLNVKQFPQISLNVTDTTICIGDSINIQTTASVTGLVYTWNNGSSNTSIGVSPVQSTSYSVVAVDSIGCSDTATANVGVSALPIVQATANSTHQCANDTAVISVNTQATASTYSWNNGLNTTTFSTVLISDTTFIVNVIDSLGCSNQDSVSIMVNPIPQLTLSPSSPAICVGDTITLSVSSTVNPVTFLWGNNSTASSILVSPLATSLFSVIATDSIGCTSTIIDTIVVNDLPLISVTPQNSIICQGNSVNLSALSNVNGVTFVWSNGTAGANLNVTPNSTTLYSVIGTDANGCKNRADAEVIVNPNPTVVINPGNIAICKGDSVLLNAGPNLLNNLSYLWNTGDTLVSFYVNPQTSTIYNVQVSDTNGCTAADTMQVNVTIIPTCNIYAQSPICTADSSIITVNGSMSSGSVVNWQLDGGSVVGGSGTGPLAVKWKNAGTYTVTFDVNYMGCSSEPDTQIVEVHQTPIVHFTSLSNEACGKANIQFVNNTPGMKSYFWNFGDFQSNTDTSTLEHPMYQYNAAGSYYVSLEVVSPEGCAASLTKPGMINVYPLPIADFTMDKTEIINTNTMVNFSDRSMDAVSWEWNFDDVLSGQYNFSTMQDPYHDFRDTGVYDVTLIVNSDHNCKDTVSKRILNREGPTFYIPNAFTPNGDGNNDTFFPKGTGYDWSTYNMYIYDRWGEMIFHSQDINNTWNGKRHNTIGTEVDDVYSYIITISTPEGTPKKFVGKVVLFH